MKGSSATSARAKAAPRPTGPSSAKRPRTPTSAEHFCLYGPSELPDPYFNAYRKDLADVALAGRVIASHYAEPLSRVTDIATPLLAAPFEGSDTIHKLETGEPFDLLDNSLGWAWGYAGNERRVGYIRSDALAAS